MFFLIACLLIWVLFAIVMQRRLQEKFRLFKALIPLILLSLLISISLGINYVASAIPSINDGIGIHNFLASWIIGEDQWSIGLFKSYFDYSIIINIILITAYSGLRILKD